MPRRSYRSKSVIIHDAEEEEDAALHDDDAEAEEERYFLASSSNPNPNPSRFGFEIAAVAMEAAGEIRHGLNDALMVSERAREHESRAREGGANKVRFFRYFWRSFGAYDEIFV